MADFLYKAYLSYSHADEVWARWLHRALETYRVPGALVGKRFDGREVPAGLAPVFRDRDDLSSNASLDDGLKEALRQSEALIILCSPKSAASRWVNEEVRYFLSLGRQERVFCVLVDSPENAQTGLDGCFPPALLEVPDGKTIEPLAVDPRPFADGKDLAKLKLIAGLLGVRLDELRRREHKRKRRRQGLIAAGLVGVFLLAGLAFSARKAEQRERQSAEQMASFIVDLGEELKAEIGLEALGLISAQAMSYLKDLDPVRLSADTGIKVGLALRQIGQVSEGQGRDEEALEAFHRSRDLFKGLSEQYPKSRDLLFELGQSEFFVSHYFLLRGQQAQALEPAMRYAAVSQQLYDSDPDNVRWNFERSYAVTGLLAMEVNSSGPFSPDLLEEADESLSIAQGILESRPDDPEALANYSSVLAWAADTRMLACELELALDERLETLVMAEKALRTAPADNSNRESYAYAHSGVAAVSARLGKLDAAREHWTRSIETFENRWREDPSNQRIKEVLQMRRLFLAGVLLDHRQMDEALMHLDAVIADYPALASANTDGLDTELLAEYLLARSRVAHAGGKVELSREALYRALNLLKPKDSEAMSLTDRALLVEAQYLWWLSFGELPDGQIPLEIDASPGLKACSTALSNARVAVMQGRQDLAKAELIYLDNKGYKGADAAEVCAAMERCSL